MPKAADVDWGKIQEERNAGATTVALAEKYGVSTPTICAHTRPAKKQKSLPPPQHAGDRSDSEAALTVKRLAA